jgi:RimJ/RimL family protein N-acetyltransferase
MQLKPLDSSELIRLAADWLSRKENYQWLDFGDGRQIVTAEWLKIAMQRGTYILRVFTSDVDDRPIGLVALSNINHDFKSATIWILAGDKSYAARGYATRAASEMLTFAFGALGLRTINTWIVDRNPSIRMAQRLGFRLIGRQRQCHYIDGQPHDRLWFDLLASEHKERRDVGYRRSA